MSSKTWKSRSRLLGGLALLPVLGLFVAAAQAHPKGESHSSGFGGLKTCIMTLDTDEDGEISAEEAKKLHEEPFSELDGNGDGKITKREFISEDAREKSRKKRKEERRAKHFAKLDKNDDGKVTLDEFSAAHSERMKKKMHHGGMDGDIMEHLGNMEHGDFREMGRDIRRMAKRARHHAMKGICDGMEAEAETEDGDEE